MNKWLPTPEEPSIPLHMTSVRKGVWLEALSCPAITPAAGREGRLWVPAALSAEKV